MGCPRRPPELGTILEPCWGDLQEKLAGYEIDERGYEAQFKYLDATFGNLSKLRSELWQKLQVSERLLRDIDVATDNSVVRPAASTGSSGVRPLPLVVGFQRGTASDGHRPSPDSAIHSMEADAPQASGRTGCAPLTTATIVAFVPK
ncbi:hypothetical protein ACFE04_000032 [Oxalis oulophora]